MLFKLSFASIITPKYIFDVRLRVNDKAPHLSVVFVDVSAFLPHVAIQNSLTKN